MKASTRLIQDYFRLLRLRFWSSLWGPMVLVLMVGFSLLVAPSAIALTPSSGDLAKQPVAEVHVSLGTSLNELKFVPNNLQFTVGKRYNLLLENPSAQKHYFTAKDFADSIWTQKVEAGKVEVKGVIRELELKPSAAAEWFFVPIKSGRHQLRCTIPGHAEAGMTGVITVSASEKPA